MLLRLAVIAVLCCNEVLSHMKDEDYKIGDSHGCELPFEQVDNKWECIAALDRVDRHTTHDQSGKNWVGNYLVGLEMAESAHPGCGFIREGSLRNGEENQERSFINNVGSAVYAAADWKLPPLPYCKRKGTKLHRREVVFHGDASIDDWETTSDLFPGSYNIALNNTCKGLLTKGLNDMLDEFDPSVIVVACGEVDLDQGQSVRKTYRRFKRLTRTYLNHHASVIYLGTKPKPMRGSARHAKYRKFDLSVKRLVRKRAGGYHNHNLRGAGQGHILHGHDHAGRGHILHGHDHTTFAMIDVHSNFMEAGNPRSLYRFDGVRLSGAAYKLYTSWTKKALEDATCIMWGDGTCKRRVKMSTLRRATMVTGSSKGTSNATSILPGEIIV